MDRTHAERQRRYRERQKLRRQLGQDAGYSDGQQVLAVTYDGNVTNAAGQLEAPMQLIMAAIEVGRATVTFELGVAGDPYRMAEFWDWFVANEGLRVPFMEWAILHHPVEWEREWERFRSLAAV